MPLFQTFVHPKDSLESQPMGVATSHTPSLVSSATKSNLSLKGGNRLFCRFFDGCEMAEKSDEVFEGLLVYHRDIFCDRQKSKCCQMVSGHFLSRTGHGDGEGLGPTLHPKAINFNL